jgi:long-subunit fatty acid transport protein
MMFQYYGNDQLQGLQGLQYPQQPPHQQQQQGMDPGSMMNIGSKFMGGGAATGSQATGNTMAAEGIGSAGTTGGGGWAGGGSSAVSSAGPWAALAAIIMINEYNAVGGGYRSEDKGKYTQDLFSGEVLGQDLEQRWLPKLGLDEGSKENKWASHLIHPISADLGESWESFKDLF